jgi:hypothetical protein
LSTRRGPLADADATTAASAARANIGFEVEIMAGHSCSVDFVRREYIPELPLSFPSVKKTISRKDAKALRIAKNTCLVPFAPYVPLLHYVE